MYDFKTKLEPFARGFLNCESDSKIKKMGAGFLQAAKEFSFKFDLEKGFVYSVFDWAISVAMWGTDSLFLRPWILNEHIENHPEDKDDIIYIREQMQPWIKHQDMGSNCYTEEQNVLRNDGSVWGGWMGHAVPDLFGLAVNGTDFYRKKIETYREKNPGKDDFYDALLMTLDGFDILGGRIKEAASEMLKNQADPENREKLEVICRTFDHAPKEPCRDFAEGAIIYIWAFSIDGVDSPGHFDQRMYDLWKVTDPTVRRKYLEAIWERFHETRTWNLCIGGSDENWNDLTNDLTYEVLDVTAKFKYHTPNLTMRCHRNTPEKLLREAYRAISTGCGMPTLYNDEAVCPALEKLGIPPCDSHRYVMNGCNQIDIHGKSHMGLEDGEVLITRALEYTLFDGLAPKRGKVFGLRTGDPCRYETYDEFYNAFLKQLDALTDQACDMSNTAQRFYATESPSPIRSIFIDGCIERGLDYKAGGPLYGHGQILAEGIADTIDSLAAIKKFVYEDKKYTMAELVDALNKDFVGYDDMYHTLKNTELKFGNDIEYVDSIGAEVINHFNSYLMTIPTERGGYYSGGCSPVNRAPEFGARLGALPNGKKRDEYLLADSIGATPGFDTHGPTALLNSCLHFDHTLPGSGFILNLKFERSLFNSADGEEAFLSLCRSYFGRKGQQLSITVVSSEELLDARVHPENHRDIIVRIGGHSEFFVELAPELQENVIARTYQSF